ncbi:MAG: zinc-ribbon domain-containing protein [Desulfovibrionaceae bacterium]|nr:zinc-ribbon domain-containing protein [Desulfovibrionaceae bacterium]
MKITCPDCSFTRDVAREDLPPRTVIANCPKCGCRFRFSPSEGVLAIVEPGVTQEQPPLEPTEVNERTNEEIREEIDGGVRGESADDPLPKGAIVLLPRGKGESSESDEGGRKTGRKSAGVSGFSRALDFGNPWDEAPGEVGWLMSFYQTLLGIMLAAPRFFRTIAPNAQIYRALAFFIIISAFVSLCNIGWVSVFRMVLGESVDPQLATVFSYIAPQGNAILTLLLQTAFFTLKLYLFTTVFFVVFKFLTRDVPSFVAIFQVVAYSIAPAILSIVPLAGLAAGGLWSFACMAVGLRQVLTLSWSKIFLGFIPVLLVYLMSLRFFSTI